MTEDQQAYIDGLNECDREFILGYLNEESVFEPKDTREYRIKNIIGMFEWLNVADKREVLKTLEQSLRADIEFHTRILEIRLSEKE